MSKLSQTLCALTLCSLMFVAMSSPWRHKKWVREGSINMCLVECALCFDVDDPASERDLMTCANSLCLNDLRKGKGVPSEWTNLCPGLGKVWVKDY